jgi:hypothetical protein
MQILVKIGEGMQRYSMSRKRGNRFCEKGHAQATG